MWIPSRAIVGRPALPDPLVVALVAALIERALCERSGLLIVGLSGAQGSGKSTLAAALACEMKLQGTTTAVLSLDDLYLTRDARMRLAAAVHPLFATRGVPGTHDVALGLELVDKLRAGERVRLPRFDKARDDRAPEVSWPWAAAGARVLLLEGWCVGARPQPNVLLAEPVNALEREEDVKGVWRRYVNARLAEDYQALFGMVDLLVMLAAPNFEAVARWRWEQESAASPGPATMDAPAVARFVRHYERLTRFMMAEMPARADLVVPLDEARRPLLDRLGGLRALDLGGTPP